MTTWSRTNNHAMRLLYFVPLLSTVGGQERTLTDKANFLASRGHQVMFVTYEHEGPLAYQLDASVEHRDLHCHVFTLYRYPLWRRFFEMLRLKRQFRDRLRGVQEQFRPDAVVVAIPNTENFICDVMRVAGATPVVVESHLAYGHDVIRRGVTEKWLYRIFNPRKAIARAQLLIALTEGDARCWREQGMRRVTVIPNPVTSYPEAIPQLPSSVSAPRIICVGRLTPQKRIDRLIDAFALIAGEFPAWHVDIFGEGELKEQLLRQIADKGLGGRVRILPPTGDIYSEYLRSQLFVLCSDFEGFGLVIVEAMACGMPVVVTDCPYGPSEIIEDGISGLLSRLDAEDLAVKMARVMADDALRLAMGRQARLSAARFRKERVIPLWEQAYRSAAGQ